MTTNEPRAEIRGFSASGATPTPWARAVEQLKAADTFWISSVRNDGRPHVTPLIAVWLDEALLFTTGPEEVKAANLAANAACALTTGSASLAADGLDIVIEGRAQEVTAPDELERVAVGFADKYGRET